jgi:cation transport regulator ChaB
MSDPAVNNSEQQVDMVNQVNTTDDQAALGDPHNSNDRIASDRDSSGGQNVELPPEVTDKLMDGADQIFMAAFNSAQDDGLSREASMQVAWNSIKTNYDRSPDGSWHLREQPRDETISGGVEGSAS